MCNSIADIDEFNVEFEVYVQALNSVSNMLYAIYRQFIHCL